MTDGAQPRSNDDAATSGAVGTRRATITSEVAQPETVAAAIAPDDTDEIDTRVEGDLVVTTIERETTGGLEATIDDYVVALDVATATVANAAETAPTAANATDDEAGGQQDAETDAQHAERQNTDTS